MSGAALLEEPIQGALTEDGVAICVAALVRIDEGVAYVAVPAETGLPSEFVPLGDVVSLPLTGGSMSDTRFGCLPAAQFSDLDVDVDEAAVRFSVEGEESAEWPDPAALVAAVPAEVRPDPPPVAATDIDAGPPRGRGRAAAGRGRGGPPPANAPPGPGAGRGRVTLATIADQMGRLVAGLQGVRQDVGALSLRVADIETAGPRAMPDLFGSVGAAPADSQGLVAEVAARRAGGPSLGAAQPPVAAGYTRRPPSLAGGGDAVRAPAARGQSLGPPPGLGSLPGAPVAGRPGLPSGPSGPEEISAPTLAAMIAEQTAVLKRLRQQDPEDDDPDGELKLPGAKGAAAMDALMRKKNTKPAFFTAIVTEALQRLAAQQPGAAEVPAPSAKAYAGFSIPFMSQAGPMRTLGYLTWGVATAWDELHNDQPEKALCTLSLLLVACEQAALDEGSWPLAWLLSLLPAPPWASMLRRADTHALRPYAKLADTRWVSASLSFLRDVERIKAARREAKPAGSEARTEEPPKAGPKGPGKGKTKDGTKGVPSAGG